MAKISTDLSVSTLDGFESKIFPEACKFCLEENCIGCSFREERIVLQADLLLEAEPTLEKFELQQFAYKGQKGINI